MEKTALDEGNHTTVEYLKEVSVCVKVSKSYTNIGVFRPLEPVELPEHQRVRVTIEDEEDWLDTTYMEWCVHEMDDRVSLEAVRQALAKIPSLTADFIAERAEP